MPVNNERRMTLKSVKSMYAQTLPKNAPIKIPGQMEWPLSRAQASIKPEGSQTGVTFPGGIDNICPIFAVTK